MVHNFPGSGAESENGGEIEVGIETGTGSDSQTGATQTGSIQIEVGSNTSSGAETQTSSGSETNSGTQTNTNTGGTNEGFHITSLTTIHFLLKDHLGSTLATANEKSIITSKHRYDAYGRTLSRVVTNYNKDNNTGSKSSTQGYKTYQPNLRSDVEQTRNSYYNPPVVTRLYTGRELETNADLQFFGTFSAAKSGLYYYRARYYSAGLGRFLERDPIGVKDDLNLYAYVKQNPVNYTDPDGKRAKAALVLMRMGIDVSMAVSTGAPMTDGGLMYIPSSNSLGIGVDTLTGDTVRAAGRGIATGGAVVTVVGGIPCLIYAGQTAACGIGALSLTAATEGAAAPSFGMCAAPAAAAAVSCSASMAGAAIAGAGLYMSANSGKGSQNPKVRDAAARGRAEHSNYNPGEQYVKEQVTPSGKGRVDAIDVSSKVIRELKPNNPRAIQKGQKQLERYIQDYQSTYGGEWKGYIDTY